MQAQMLGVDQVGSKVQLDLEDGFENPMTVFGEIIAIQQNTDSTGEALQSVTVYTQFFNANFPPDGEVNVQ